MLEQKDSQLSKLRSTINSLEDQVDRMKKRLKQISGAPDIQDALTTLHDCFDSAIHEINNADSMLSEPKYKIEEVKAMVGEVELTADEIRNALNMGHRIGGGGGGGGGGGSESKFLGEELEEESKAAAAQQQDIKSNENSQKLHNAKRELELYKTKSQNLANQVEEVSEPRHIKHPGHFISHPKLTH